MTDDRGGHWVYIVFLIQPLFAGTEELEGDHAPCGVPT